MCPRHRHSFIPSPNLLSREHHGDRFTRPNLPGPLAKPWHYRNYLSNVLSTCPDKKLVLLLLPAKTGAIHVFQFPSIHIPHQNMLNPSFTRDGQCAGIGKAGEQCCFILFQGHVSFLSFLTATCSNLQASLEARFADPDLNAAICLRKSVPSLRTGAANIAI